MKRVVRRTRRRAFTLLEVLMVVVIIGLLAAFVVPNFFGTETKTKINLSTALVKSGINGTLDRYRLDMGHYPTTEEGLIALVQKPDNEEDAKKWAGPYVKAATDLKDSWGTDLIYKCPGEYNSDGYDLSSAGPDRQPGTDDDIGNWVTR